MQGEDANEAFDILEHRGVGTLFEHLQQWETGDEEALEFEPWGCNDTLYAITTNRAKVGESLRYHLAVNHRLGYVSLTREKED
jgi:hypothetical protein